MKKNLIIASLIAIGILLWLASGALREPAVVGDITTTAVLPPDGQSLMRVRVREFQAQQRMLTQILRGKTESKRSARVAAEIVGRVISRPVERGDRVSEGDLLCELAVDDRRASLAEAQAELERARLEKRGAEKLRGQELLSDIRIAQVDAELAAAEARVERETLNLARTRITAPFDGVVETLQLDVGDLARVGDVCATVLDLDPLLITASVSERNVNNIHLGDRVTARTSTDERLEGVVSFVGAQSDDATRTYPVEVTVPNPDYRLRAGLTTTVSVSTVTVLAHRVSPALFTLDDEGNMGLRAVNNDNTVVFHPVKVVEDAPSGAWVTGLPGIVKLITVGHEYVSEGQRVEIELDGSPVASAGAL
jgi:multidrug efflux system membrane fusion protein